MEASNQAEEAVQVGVSGEDVEAEHHDQEPIGDDGDGHGTVTPRSAPPAAAQSGDPLDPATKAALAGSPPAQGESAPPV